jgi:molybdopterin/thiamine biosynthesis adenylyltransferase
LNTPENRQKLDLFHVGSHNAYQEAAFCRNLGLLDANEQNRLQRAVVAVAGLGGVGGGHLITLARSGVGGFRLADFDRFDPVNVNRQYGATVSAFGREKLRVMAENALEVNPHLSLTLFEDGVTEANVDAFLDGADLVMDGLDFFVFEVRRMVFKKALEKGIPVVTAGPMGFSSALLVFTPDGMGFDEYFDIREEDTYIERILKFAMGLAPRPTHFGYVNMDFVDLRGKRGPSLGCACQACASLAATEALRLLLGRKGVKPVPCFLQFDPYARKLVKGRLRMGNRHPVQRLKLWIAKNFMLDRNKVIGPVKPDQPDLAADGLNAVREYVVRAGIQAPSGDNCQPWRFSGAGETIALSLDKGTDESFFNVRQAASIVACGAAMENMTLAAQACGLTPEVELNPEEGAGRTRLATLTLKQGEDVPEPVLHDAVWQRCTNRKFYSRKTVSDGVWEHIREAVERFPGTTLQWISAPGQLKIFAESACLADRIRTEHRGLHEHLNTMIRFSQKDAEETRDGLPLGNLEAGRAGNLFLKATRSWPVMSALNTLGASRGVAAHSGKGIRRSGGVGLICAQSLDTESLFRAGRALERAWLTFTHYGIRFQPSAAPALFRLRWLLEGEASFSPAHGKLLGRAWSLAEECFPGFLATNPVLFFRVGFGPRIKYGTYRKPLSAFLGD